MRFSELKAGYLLYIYFHGRYFKKKINSVEPNSVGIRINTDFEDYMITYGKCDDFCIFDSREGKVIEAIATSMDRLMIETEE